MIWHKEYVPGSISLLKRMKVSNIMSRPGMFYMATWGENGCTPNNQDAPNLDPVFNTLAFIFIVGLNSWPRWFWKALGGSLVLRNANTLPFFRTSHRKARERANGSLLEPWQSLDFFLILLAGFSHEFGIDVAAQHPKAPNHCASHYLLWRAARSSERGNGLGDRSQCMRYLHS